MNKGWICLHRDIFDNFLYTEKPFCRIAAFIDLILLANHDDNDIFFDGEIMTVKRGQYVTSTRKLGERWGWSRTKIMKFFNVLQRQGMIQKESDKKKTLLTLVNYGKYQDMKDSEMPLKRHTKDSEVTLKNTNNNDNNINNENNDIYSDRNSLIWSEITKHGIKDCLIHEYTIKQFFEKLGKDRFIQCIEKSSGKNGSYLIKVCETVLTETPKTPKTTKTQKPSGTGNRKPKMTINQEPSRTLTDEERRELDEILNKL